MKKYLVVFLIISLFLITGFKKDEKSKEKETEKIEVSVVKKPVKVQKIERRIIEKMVVTNSDLTARNEIDQIAKYGGDIDKIYFKNGEEVKKGDIIIKLSDSNIESSYKTAKANYEAQKASYEEAEKFTERRLKSNFAAANTNLVNAKETLERAKRGADKEEQEQAESSVIAAEKNFEVQKINYDKYKTLYDKKLISEMEFLNVENGYKNAESNYIRAKRQLEIVQRGTDKEDIVKLEAAYNLAQTEYELVKKYVEDEAWKYEIAGKKAQHDIAKANYELAKKILDDLTVRAEISGKIAGLDLKENTIIGKEKYLFTIVDDLKMEGKSGVSGEELLGLDLGKEVEVYVESIKKFYKGKIVEINPKADPATRKFFVKFEIDNDGVLKSGMYSKVTIPTISKESIVVPAKSLVVKDLASYIFTVENNVAKKIRVETGISSEDTIEVLTNSVKEGEMLVVEGQFLLDDQNEVRIIESM